MLGVGEGLRAFAGAHWCLCVVALAAVACASTAVPPSKLPAAPHAPPGTRGALVLVPGGVPEPVIDELRAFARTTSPTGAVSERALGSGETLAAACPDAAGLVLRPALGRSHFVSNAPDRNTLFIYETAIIVGIPVTLVSAVAWPFYAETLVEGELEVLDCATGESTRHVDAFRLRSEGRGFVRTAPLRDAQIAAAQRGVTRELLALAFQPDREGRTR